MKKINWVSRVVTVLLVFSLGLLAGCGGTSTKTTVAQDVAIFDLAVGNAGNDAPYIVTNSGGGNDGARFADGTSELIYRFDLPDSASAGTLTLTIGNEYVVSLSKDNSNWTEELRETAIVTDISNLRKQTISLTPYLTNNSTKTVYVKLTDAVTSDGWGSFLTHIAVTAKVVPKEVTTALDLTVGNAGNDASYIVTNSGGGNSGARFADGTSELIYQFSLPSTVDGGTLALTVGNQYLVYLSRDGIYWTEVLRETTVITDNSNQGIQKISITPYLIDNSSKTVYVKLSDAFTGDGFGSYLTHITLSTYRF